MAELTVRCPKCNQWIKTGVGGDAPTVTEHLRKGNIIQCPHCQASFRWHARNALPEEPAPAADLLQIPPKRG